MFLILGTTAGPTPQGSVIVYPAIMAMGKGYHRDSHELLGDDETAKAMQLGDVRQLCVQVVEERRPRLVNDALRYHWPRSLR